MRRREFRKPISGLRGEWIRLTDRWLNVDNIADVEDSGWTLTVYFLRARGKEQMRPGELSERNKKRARKLILFGEDAEKFRAWLKSRGVILILPKLELNLMSDNGSQPTSLSFIRECRTLGIRQSLTAYANPLGNADTERLIRTIKEELIWLREWSTAEEVAIEVENFVEYFNDNYLHSALNYKTPNAFEHEWFKNNQFTLSAAA